VFQQSTDVEPRDLRESAYPSPAKSGFSLFHNDWWTVHSRTVIAIQRLRHERRGLSKLVCSIANYVFEYLKIVCRSQQCGIAKVDFTLPAVALRGGDIRQSRHTCPTSARSRAQIDQRIGRRTRHVAFLRTNAIAEIRSGKLVRVAAAVPVCFVESMREPAECWSL
jgi:hypothetical protein